MSRWLRRIRGAIGMGVAWAVAWFAAGMALLVVVGPDAADVPFPLGFGLLGFFAGALFSGVLSLVAGRREFDQLSIPRFAGWGAVGGLVFSVRPRQRGRWPWPGGRTRPGSRRTAATGSSVSSPGGKGRSYSAAGIESHDRVGRGA